MGRGAGGKRANRERVSYLGQTARTDENGNPVMVSASARRPVSRQARNGSESSEMRALRQITRANYREDTKQLLDDIRSGRLEISDETLNAQMNAIGVSNTLKQRYAKAVEEGRKAIAKRERQSRRRQRSNPGWYDIQSRNAD